MATYKVLAFGELLWDLLPAGPVLGGAPFNFGYRVNELGDVGVPVSRVGSDDLGNQAITIVRSLRVSTEYLQRDAKLPTGTVKVSFDKNNEPEYVILPGVAYDQIAFSSELAWLAREADCICFGTLIQRSPVSSQTLYSLLEACPSALKFLDVNLRRNCFTAESVRQALVEADILKTNESEIAEVARILGLKDGGAADQAQRICGSENLLAVVVTLGDRGVYACGGDGRRCYVPGYRVDVADSIGSGDAFSAGFLHSWLRSEGLERSCAAGNRLGAFVATQRGGTAPVDPALFARFYAAHRDRNTHPEFEKFGC